MIPLHTPVDDLLLTVVDVETTGLSVAAGDRVCEIALLQVQGGREVRRFASLVRPPRPMSPGATAVNGITDAMLATAPPFAAVLPAVQALLRDTVLVAHNAPFDLGFLHHEFRLAGAAFPALPVVDTLLLARTHYRFPSNSLAAIAAMLGIIQPEQHRALADVWTTWQVLRRFLADLRRRGPVTLGQLLAPRAAPASAVPVALAEALRTGKLLLLRYRSGTTATERVGAAAGALRRARLLLLARLLSPAPRRTPLPPRPHRRGAPLRRGLRHSRWLSSRQKRSLGPWPGFARAGSGGGGAARPAGETDSGPVPGTSWPADRCGRRRPQT
ncbi:MAG: hypothetical protein KatS3mg131_2387 [Candidatus Tectimicrobiota bacterium]|nr:MAG: hypothetical protein KatS3mg131_2387 [Candidatus Tectomicrobia bacterium]